jgi:hypothetical protein
MPNYPNTFNWHGRRWHRRRIMSFTDLWNGLSSVQTPRPWWRVRVSMKLPIAFVVFFVGAFISSGLNHRHCWLAFGRVSSSGDDLIFWAEAQSSGQDDVSSTPPRDEDTLARARSRCFKNPNCGRANFLNDCSDCCQNRKHSFINNDTIRPILLPTQISMFRR